MSGLSGAGSVDWVLTFLSRRCSYFTPSVMVEEDVRNNGF